MFRDIFNEQSWFYYKKLIKASLFVSTVPVIVVWVLFVYGRLSFLEGVLGVVAVFCGSIVFAKPYLDDLSALTNYVKHLASDNKSEAPPLSFLGNVEELSKSVKELHNLWEERKVKLEAALAESSMLFDTIPDVLIMLDKKMRVVRTNNAAVGVFGDALAGSMMKDVVDNDVLIGLIDDVIVDGKEGSMELEIRMHGVVQDYSVVVEKFPVRSVGGVVVVVVMYNITESKRRKQMMKDFVANASHEIRTPLTSVVGFIETLQDIESDKNVSETKKKRKEFLFLMSEQADRMSHLVNDLLSLSKVEMNESLPPTEMVNVVDIINEVEKRLSYLAVKKDMSIKLKFNKRVPEVVGDHNELTQVFTNLINNAIKYGYNGSEVQVATKVVTKFRKYENMPKDCEKLLLISVSDEGEGIPAEYISRITERFYRVDKVRSRKVGGTGLGLSIAKHIVQHHMGDLRIESKLGKGSVFTVCLPLSSKE